jgi:hypothetical protein
MPTRHEHRPGEYQRITLSEIAFQRWFLQDTEQSLNDGKGTKDGWGREMERGEPGLYNECHITQHLEIQSHYTPKSHDLVPVIIKTTIFCDVTPCSPVDLHCFG